MRASGIHVLSASWTEEKHPQQAWPATGIPLKWCQGQSRKATFRMALDCPSVFMTTWCQPLSVIVA